VQKRRKAFEAVGVMMGRVLNIVLRSMLVNMWT
jgi:hypothetical protein